ncbi:MAG TPA: acetolactate synthase large subunit [Bryobacteraceae bacterium]|nr:acetolactate synthase large subunit [Bryobacteraceae bacterium]
MNGAECLLRTLLANGIEVCFMNPGTSEMQFVAALDRLPDMRGVLCLFEGVCSGAADGYARIAGRPAATLLHLGPGLGNALANFHNARKARSPIVSIVGEHTTEHLRYDAPLTANIAAFARAVSDNVCLVGAAAKMGALAAAAIEAATRPPGQTATLIIPADHSWSDAGDPGPSVNANARRMPAPDRIADIITLLARSPTTTGLLLSGSAMLRRGVEAAGRIAAKTGARIFADRNAARTASGRGRFHPERIGYFPEKAEAQLAGLRDLVLIEAKAPVSFFGYPGRRSTLAPEHCAMHVLATVEEDGAGALESLADMLPQMADPAAPHEPEETAALRGDESLGADLIGRCLAQRLPEDAIVCDEAVSSAEPIWPWLLRAAPHDYLPICGGAIGIGMPLGVGAAIAAPGRKVVVLEADGSGMYTAQALWTMAREQLDVVVIVFANRRYRILDIEMRRTGAHGFGPRANDMIDISRPDIGWTKLANSMGVAAARVTTAGEFAVQFSSAMREPGPLLIEAML